MEPTFVCPKGGWFGSDGGGNSGGEPCMVVVVSIKPRDKGDGSWKMRLRGKRTKNRLQGGGRRQSKRRTTSGHERVLYRPTRASSGPALLLVCSSFQWGRALSEHARRLSGYLLFVHICCLGRHKEYNQTQFLPFVHSSFETTSRVFHSDTSPTRPLSTIRFKVSTPSRFSLVQCPYSELPLHQSNAKEHTTSLSVQRRAKERY